MSGILGQITGFDWLAILLLAFLGVTHVALRRHEIAARWRRWRHGAALVATEAGRPPIPLGARGDGSPDAVPGERLRIFVRISGMAAIVALPLVIGLLVRHLVGPTLPGCDDAQVTKLAANELSRQSELMRRRIEVYRVDQAEEITGSASRRYCLARLATLAGPGTVRFFVTWLDRERAVLRVTIERVDDRLS